MNTFLLFAAASAGFACGVLATLVFGVILAGIGAFGWWRFCLSIERAGLDIKIPLPEPAKDQD